MKLTKYKLGDLIEIVDKKNIEGLKYPFYGINKQKEFMPTVAATENLNPSKYNILEKGEFLFSGMQTGRDKCIRISLFQEENKILVSPAYTIFKVVREDIIDKTYLFMTFLTSEKDRYGWFISDSSVRSNLDWDRFCDIEITLPDIETQQKYVDIYNSMLRNQKSYERGLEDLKLVCDAYVEKLIHNSDLKKLGPYITRIDERNKEDKYDNVKGVSVFKEFREPTSKVNRNKLQNYKIVRPRQFSFVQTTNNEKVFSNALNTTKEIILVTSVNEVFSVDENIIIPEYLKIIFDRTEFDRYARFHSWGSARETFNWEDLCNVKIPIPPMEVQESIADIYKVYKNRKMINEKLKQQLKDICPILIKGSLQN